MRSEMIVQANKILFYLKRALAWISARFFKHMGEQDALDGEREAGITMKLQPLVVIDQPAHPNNYGDRPAGIEISLIVLHYTASGSLDATVRWFQNWESKVSAHYVIDKDGTIVRMVPEEKKAYHAGMSEWNGQQDVNRFSIGIELVNWGKLVKRDGRLFTWPNDHTNPYHGPVPVFLDDAWWDSFPEVQLCMLDSLISDIASKNPINEVLGHCEVSTSRKIDPGPALPSGQFKRLFQPPAYSSKNSTVNLHVG